MSDITPIKGPGAPIEPGGKKEKTPADTEKFKELMKVEKVRETDAEEQKKRKRREEAEEEEPQEEEAPPPSPPLTPTTPTAPSQPTLTISSTTPSAPTVSKTPLQGAAEEEGFWQDIEAFIDHFVEQTKESAGAPPTAQPPTAEPQAAPPTAEPPAAPPQPPTPAPQPPGTPLPPPPPPPTAPPPIIQPQEGIQPSQLPQGPQAPPSKTEEEAKKVQKKPAPTEPVKGLETLKGEKPSVPGVSAKGAPEEQIQPAKEEKEKFFTEFTKLEGKKPSGKPGVEEVISAEETPSIIAPSQPQMGKEEEEKEKGKSKEEKALEIAGVPETAAPPLAAFEVPAPAAPLPSYVNLSPQVLEMFERMVGVMTVMVDTSIRETTVTLNAPQFASSVFYGSQIIIQEFSTAPHSYNIQFIGNSNAVALFQGNADDLLAAFQSGNYNFRVNRLEASLFPSERPLFKRKESISEEKKDLNK